MRERTAILLFALVLDSACVECEEAGEYPVHPDVFELTGDFDDSVCDRTIGQDRSFEMKIYSASFHGNHVTSFDCTVDISGNDITVDVDGTISDPGGCYGNFGCTTEPWPLVHRCEIPGLPPGDYRVIAAWSNEEVYICVTQSSEVREDAGSEG